MDWGDVLYPGNPGRREEVYTKMGNIQSEVVSLFSSISTLGGVLTSDFPQYANVPPLNLNMSYEDNFKALDTTIEQWKETADRDGAKKTEDDAVDNLRNKLNNVNTIAGAIEHIDALMNSSESEGFKWTRVSLDLVVGTVVHKLTYTAVKPMIEGAVKSVVGAGLAGAVAGAAAAVLIDLIIGSIKGNEDRKELQGKIDQLDQTYNDLVPAVADTKKAASGTISILWRMEFARDATK